LTDEIQEFKRRLKEQEEREMAFVAEMFDPMDSALSWCRIGTFMWAPGAKGANISMSLEELSIGMRVGIPVRQWVKAVAREDRKRFVSDLRRRLATYEWPIDGIYKHVADSACPRRFLVRTVLFNRSGIWLVGSVMEVTNTNFGRNGFRGEPKGTTGRTNLALGASHCGVVRSVLSRALVRQPAGSITLSTFPSL
jgi:hypothetical protein